MKNQGLYFSLRAARPPDRGGMRVCYRMDEVFPAQAPSLFAWCPEDGLRSRLTHEAPQGRWNHFPGGTKFIPRPRPLIAQ